MSGYKMVISRCCKKPVYVYCGGEGTSFYLCGRCDMPCDTLCEATLIKDDDYDELGDVPEVAPVINNS